VAGFQDLLQFVFAGVTSGAIYALIALGFCVVHNTIGIVNFAQVDFVSLGGMFLFSGLFWRAAHGCVALPCAVAAVTVVGMAVERLGVRPSRSQNHLVLIFLTIGISIILRGIMKLVWGKNRMAVPRWPERNPAHCRRRHFAPGGGHTDDDRSGHRPAGAFFPRHPPGPVPCVPWPPTRPPPRWWEFSVGRVKAASLPWQAGWAAWPVYW
jgi:hypothetical protein